MSVSQLSNDLRLLRTDESAAQNTASATQNSQYQGYESLVTSSVDRGILEREAPFGNSHLSQKLEQLAADSVLFSPRDKEAILRFLAEGCWEGMSAREVRAIQKLLAQALSPAQQTKMGLSIDDVRQITATKSLMGTRHEPLSETAAQMRDELMASYGISESEQKFRNSMHLIDVQADGVRVLADELLRSGQLTLQSSLQEIAEKSLSLVQNRFQYFKEPTDPDGTEQDRWQSIDETMRKGGGDCEDLAILQASLLMNLMEQMGYSKKDIRDRVCISAGYMSDAAGNQKGHVLVRLQMNDGDLALDATGNTGPYRFDSLNFDVVFEANDWKFNALQPIDPAFVTALDVAGSSPESIVSRINDVMAALQEQLQTVIDIPLPKTTYSDGAESVFGFGIDDVMQREDADTGEMVDIYSTTEFPFFTLNYSTYSPPYENNRLYLAEINESFFLDYINATRNLTNELLLLYHIGNSYMDFVANEATDIGMSGYDEQTKGAMQEASEGGDKYKGKIVSTLGSFLQKSNEYIQNVASDVFSFVDSNNSAQLQLAQYKIDNFGRESLFTALPSAIADELTNAMQMVRIQKKVELTETVAKMAASNMSAYVSYARGMTESLQLWSEGTSKEEITSGGALNFGEKVWDELESSTGAKSKYLAYLDQIQAQVDMIKDGMKATATYTDTYGLLRADLNKDPLEGQLFGAHGDADQYVQTNMDQMAKLLQHNAKFQNMVGIALLIRQTMQETQRELASNISGKKGTSSSGQLSGVALSSLSAELSKQGTALSLMQNGAVNLSAQATGLMTERISYEKDTRTTAAKAVKLALEIAGLSTGYALGVSAGTASAGASATAYAFALTSNPFTAALGAAALAEGLAVYTELWSTYYEKNTGDTVSAAAELAYSGAQYSSELLSKEVGTTYFIQESDTFGREEDGASASGGGLAAANQANTDIWSDGEREYYSNRTSANLFLARDAYNMQVDEAIHVGGLVNGTASGTRNTQRTEFIADRGDGSVLNNGLLMGSREADTAMLQGSVYALVGIFRAQRDAMENIISQSFGVQKANKSNAMSQQIETSLGLEQSLVALYKQDSNQRLQALNMLVSEDKRQTDYIKEMATKSALVGMASAAWANIPIPTVAPLASLAKVTYEAAAAALNLGNQAINLTDALYKYDAGPYSANFASYHTRDLNDSEKAYRDELSSSLTASVPSIAGLSGADRYARLDQLESQQLAKLVDYGGGVGEWGDNLHDDSILEYSNEFAEGIELPFRQVNYGNASRVYNEITGITALRVFYAMIDQALYQQKQNTLRLMVGTSSSAGHLGTMMQILDKYNSSILNGTYDSLLEEANSRAMSSNAYENNTVSKSIEYALTGAVLLTNTPLLFRAAKATNGGTGYSGAQSNVKAVTRAAEALRVVGAAAEITFGSMLMYTVKGSNPDIDSTMATYDEDDNGEPTTKTVTDTAQTITRGGGGQQYVSAAEKNRAQTLAKRRERQISLMREIGLAMDNATADAAEEVGGVSSSKSFNQIAKIIKTFASADVKQAEFTYQALKQQADAYNRGIQRVVDGAAQIAAMAMNKVSEKLDKSKDAAAKAKAAKGQTGTGGSNSSNVKGQESKNAQSSEVRSTLFTNLNKGLNSAVTHALIETVLWAIGSGMDGKFYSPFASDASNANAQVEGESEANSKEGGLVASTDNLENALLGVSLMQANTALLRELQQDRIQLASKMAASPSRFLREAIKTVLPRAIKNTMRTDQEKEEEQRVDDAGDMDSDEFSADFDAFLNPYINTANATETDRDAFVRHAAAQFDKDPELKATVQELKDAEGKNLHEKYTKKYGTDYLDKPDALASYNQEVQLSKAAAFLKKKGTGKGDTENNSQADKDTSTLGKSLVNAIKENKPEPVLSPEKQRMFTALLKLKLLGATAEESYLKLQDYILAKATKENLNKVGSTTIAEAQAGMASKDGLIAARKQKIEVSKLEKTQEAILFKELGIGEVDPAALNGDPNEQDPQKRRDKKDKAIEDYVNSDNFLNERFYNLSPTAQARAMTEMGMSQADRTGLLDAQANFNQALEDDDVAGFLNGRVSPEKELELVSDFRDLRGLKTALDDVISVGKVDNVPNAGKSTADRYLGRDKRLNAAFYALSENKQRDALRKMGVDPGQNPNLADDGKQINQDGKIAVVKAIIKGITETQSTRLDSKNKALTIEKTNLESRLEKEGADLAVLDGGLVIPGVTRQGIVDEITNRRNQLTGAETALRNLGPGGAAREIRTLQGLGRIAKLDMPREVAMLGAEFLRREGSVPMEALALERHVRQGAGITDEMYSEYLKDRKQTIREALDEADLVKDGTLTQQAKDMTVDELRQAIGNLHLLEGEGPAVLEALTRNDQRKAEIIDRLRELQDFRPADRHALRKEIHELRADTRVVGLNQATTTELINRGILHQDGTLNATEVAKLQANPEEADTVFSAVSAIPGSGIDGGALKAKVLGLAKQEERQKLQKQLTGMEDAGLRAMGIDPDKTPSARIRLAVSDANSDPDGVRKLLQIQAATYRETALTESEAEENKKDPTIFSSNKQEAIMGALALRIAGAVFTAGATEIAMGLNSINETPAVKQARKERKDDLKAARDAKSKDINRVGAAQKFQENIDQLVGVDPNARVADNFVKGYTESLKAAKENSDTAKDVIKKKTAKVGADNYFTYITPINEGDLGRAVDTARANVLNALVAERDAAVKIRKLAKEGDLGKAADIVRYIAAGGETGQALAAGVLRRLAADENTRDLLPRLLDRAVEGVSPDQLQGLGGAVVQALGADLRFEGLVIKKLLKGADKDKEFDLELGRLYGVSGWHKSPGAPVDQFHASVKSERGSAAFALAMRDSRGFIKALASASPADIAASLGNLLPDPGPGGPGGRGPDGNANPRDRVTNVLNMLSGAAGPGGNADPENQRQAQQALVKMADSISGMPTPLTRNAGALQAMLARVAPQTQITQVTDNLKASVATMVAEGLAPSFSENMVPSDYFKKLDEAVLRPGFASGDKVDGAATALAEISQKLKQDPTGAGAELENVKDRVAKVIEAAVAQGHEEDVLRVLDQLREAGLGELVKDLGSLVAVQGDGGQVLEDLQRANVRQGRAAADRLNDFTLGVRDKDIRIVGPMVQAQVDNAEKESALRRVADRMVAGDVTLVKAVLGDKVLRQDLASLVAEGVALNMASAYRILSLIGEKPQRERELFAEEVGLRLSRINVDIKTSSRKVDLKQIEERLKAMDKTGSKRTEIEAFSKQIAQGYGVQLYGPASLIGLSRRESLDRVNTWVNTNKTQKVENAFRKLAEHDPQAAVNLMTDALRGATPNLATTMYEGITKAIPGANGLTLDQIKSFIAVLNEELGALGVVLPQNLHLQMTRDLGTIATALRDQDVPTGNGVFHKALSTMVKTDGDTLSIPAGQKPFALLKVQQGASRMEASLAQDQRVRLMAVPNGPTAFGKLTNDPGSMMPADIQSLTDFAKSLPPTQGRELRLLVGVAAMAVRDATSPSVGLINQQVLDMIVVGQGDAVTSQMVTNALGSPDAAGKLDAVESLLQNTPDKLDFSPTSGSFEHIKTALSAPAVDPAQRKALLQPGGAFDQKVGKQLKHLSIEDVIAFEGAQVSAGVALTPSHFPEKLEIEAGKLDSAKGIAVKKAMTEVANGTKTMQVALTELTTAGGDLDETPLAVVNYDSVIRQLDALGELTGHIEALGEGAPPQGHLAAIQVFLDNPAQSQMLKTQQPYLYLAAMATPGIAFGQGAGEPMATDLAVIQSNADAINAYLDPTVTAASIGIMENNLGRPFLNRTPGAEEALVLIAAADASAARPRLPWMLATMQGVDRRDLAARLKSLSGTVAATNLGASNSLSRSATVLRQKLAVGDHTVLKDLAQKALRHHHKGQSYEGQLAAMSAHVHSHKAAFVAAMTTAPYSLDHIAAEQAVDKMASSEGGIPGMLTLLDAQERTMRAPGGVPADARAMQLAKIALAEVYVDSLIKDDTLSIAGLDRQLATVLVESLRDGMNTIMPRLKHRLQSSESVDRLTALIGQSNLPLVGAGGMREVRDALFGAADIFDMNNPVAAAATLGRLQHKTDFVAGALALYGNPVAAGGAAGAAPPAPNAADAAAGGRKAAEVLNQLVRDQGRPLVDAQGQPLRDAQGQPLVADHVSDSAFAVGILGAMPEPANLGVHASDYWNALFGGLNFANDDASRAALRSGMQRLSLAARFDAYFGVNGLPIGAGMPANLNSPAEKAQLRIHVATSMNRFDRVLPPQVTTDTIAMLNTHGHHALNEMMANPQARATLGRLVAENDVIRGMVADIVAEHRLSPGTLSGVLKLPGVAADLRSRPITDDYELLLAKVMVDPSLVKNLPEFELRLITKDILTMGDPTGVLPHLMENPYAMGMIEADLRGTSPGIRRDQALDRQAQALKLIGLARNGQNLGRLLKAMPTEKLREVLGNPRFLEGRSDKMAMLDAGISAVIMKGPNLGSAAAAVLFNELTYILDRPTYGGLNGTPDMSTDGVPKGVKLLIIKHMMAKGYELDERHERSYESGIPPALENTSWLASLEAGAPDILFLEDALVEASGDPAKRDALIQQLHDVLAQALINSVPGQPNPVADFLTTSRFGKSMMVQLTAMEGLQNDVLNNMRTNLALTNFNRLNSALVSGRPADVFIGMAQSGVLLTDDQKRVLAVNFVNTYSVDAANIENDARRANIAANIAPPTDQIDAVFQRLFA